MNENPEPEVDPFEHEGPHIVALWIRICGDEPQMIAQAEIEADAETANGAIATLLRSVANIIDTDNTFSELVAEA